MDTEMGGFQTVEGEFCIPKISWVCHHPSGDGDQSGLQMNDEEKQSETLQYPPGTDDLLKHPVDR